MNDKNTNKAGIYFAHIAIIVIAVIIAYSKVFKAGFMSWDDLDYMSLPDLQTLSWESFKNLWTDTYLGNYQPLPMLSYAIDYAIGQGSAAPFHISNVIWHIASVVMLHICMNRLQENRWISLFIALLFALHPVQTESVSWVAARNKEMNGFFFFLAIYSYIGYLITHNRKKLLFVYLWGIAAYLCKSTAIMLPFALIAVDIWWHRPLNKKMLWLEKIPLLLFAIPIGIITLQAQQDVEFLNLHPEFHLGHKVVFAGYAYVQYLINLFAPVKLSVLYPYPKGIKFIHILYTIIALAIVVWGVVAYRKKQYVLAGGILFYTVNIAIVLQFIQFGEMLMADRYLYIACIGVWYPVVYYIFRFLKNSSFAIAANAAIVIIFLSATFMRNDIWLSELNFWKSILAKFPESSIAQSSLGGVYMNMGRNEEAEAHIDKALAIDTKNYKAWYNKGALLLKTGNVNGALDAMNKALVDKDYTKALFTRALIYQQTGRCNNALIDIEKVLKEEPRNARAYFIKAECTEQMGKFKESIKLYDNAIKYESNEPLFYMKRGLAYARINDNAAAIHDLSLAIDLRPDYGEAWFWRGIVKHRTNRMPCDDLNRARQLGFKEAERVLIEVCNSY